MNSIGKKNLKENNFPIKILREKVDGEFFFTLFLFILLLIFFFETFGYEFEGKMIPFIILIPTLFTLLVILIGHFYPRVSSWIKSKGRMYELTLKIGETISKVVKEKEKIDSSGRSNLIDEIIKPITVMILFLLLIFLIGVLPAIVCFSFSFFKFYAKRGMIISLLITLVIWLFIYVVFIRLLYINFPTGFLRIPFHY